MERSMRGAVLLLILLLVACQTPAAPAGGKEKEADASKIDPQTLVQYSKNIQQYVDAMLLCGSTIPADWEEAKRKFDLLHPFFVFKEDPELIRGLKSGVPAARQELARRGVILRSMLVFVSGSYDRVKWDDARKTLRASGGAGQAVV